MEKRFDMGNFEESLKEHADHFAIAPSRKVWQGIYNDLHPGSRWPSVAMGLVFLFSLLGIGHLNNDGYKSSSDIQPNQSNPASVSGADNIDPALQTTTSALISAATPAPIFNIHTGKRIDDYAPASPAREILDDRQRSQVSPLARVDELTTIAEEKATNQSLVSGNVSLAAPGNASGISQENKSERINLISNTLPLSFWEEDVEKVAGIIQPKKLSYIGDVLNAEVKPDIKKPVAARKKNSKMEWVFFVTPKLSSAYFTGKAIQNNNTVTNQPLVIRPSQVGKDMSYNARLGFEAGTEMQYTFAPKWQVISGWQLSYSGYNIVSNKVHPALATLVLKHEDGGVYSKNYITYYGNGYSENRVILPTFSLQTSIPVGLQYELWGNENVKVQLAGSLLPSLVLSDKSYLLSANGKNYVEDPDLMRRLSLSTNFSSTVTLQSKKIKWHIGPSVRYQLTSTYKNIYPVKEHLLDYGIRIGISK